MTPMSAYTISATDARKEWSTTIDTAVRKRPVFIQRTRDSLVLLSTETLKGLLDSVKLHVTVYQEEDGSFTCVQEELALAENASDKDSCLQALLAAVRDYAKDFYEDFAFWAKAPNRFSHIPIIFKILSSSDEELMEGIVCRDGKN